MKISLYIIAAACLLLAACNNDDDGKAKEIDKKGSIAITLSTAHIDSLRDEVVTHYQVWRKGVVIKEYDKRDTIQSLGTGVTEGEDDNGDTKTMNVPKDYDFFVTVK
ncbi:hypothetical protein BEL04_16085 [Mucilaginibacter sp. PPCGB 2223]|uniref:hypothetical protein n=1 Tax=Mucilaginibacter sp. PPCGB 2223 TaxID=1886027 RepID=UPI000825A110|nr:hypothetical protein [Mucilaginibacter sp. PPCGB 2223]OCX51543.1 hypothetical protein BEL04_16085 [Mucilaginibacter sp. PPCGB 2223]